MNCNIRKNFNKSKCKRRIGEAEFRIVIPKRDNSNKPIKPQILLKYINKVNKIYGGSTTYPSVYGCYKNDSGKTQCEENFIITGVRDFNSRWSPEFNNYNNNQRTKKLEEDYNKLISLGKKASKELGQEAIFVESDYINDASFVSRNKKTKKEKLSDFKTGRNLINFKKFVKKN